MCAHHHIWPFQAPPLFYVPLLLPKPSSCELNPDITVSYKDVGFRLRRNWYYALLGSEHGCACFSPALSSRGCLCSCPGLGCPGSAPSLGGQGTFGKVSRGTVGFSCPHPFSGISSLTARLLLPQCSLLRLNGLVWHGQDLIRPEKLVSCTNLS